ncbi:MAG TPA: protein phosphatase 2C domain-containing protein [Ktedonobacterales bacterium]|nr:protein phosphatase 2C domain-containing protein [Ktedonobacterales bacterium]
MLSRLSGRVGDFSARLYHLLLFVYPRAFREEYAAEMMRTFRDAYGETAQQEGTLGVLRLWNDVFCDLVKTACVEHASSWMQRGERSFALAGGNRAAMALRFTLDIAQHTDIGRLRASNEDDVLSIVPEDDQLLREKGALFVVSDGMGGGIGGHSRGALASELAVQRVREAYYQNLRDDIPTALRRAVQEANTTICRASMTATERAQKANDPRMGATCVAAVLRDQTLSVANVGDSRAYVLHDGRLRQITRDHSVTAHLIECGEITPAEARTHAQRHLIYRALGQPEVEIDCFTESVQQGDTLILCTDGLSGVVEDEDVRAIVERYSPEESVRRLIVCANEKGGPDNITVVVVRVAA